MPQQIRPGVQRILDALTAPALVSNARMDYLAANRLGRALYAPLFDSPVGTNAARFLLLDPRGADFYPDWDQAVDDVVALMRTEAGRSPFDKVLTDLIGELSTRSETFRARWARHDVRLHLTGTKRLRHPVVGDLDLRFETMELPADPGLALLLYTAEPGSADRAGTDVPRQLGRRRLHPGRTGRGPELSTPATTPLGGPPSGHDDEPRRAGAGEAG